MRALALPIRATVTSQALTSCLLFADTEEYGFYVYSCRKETTWNATIPLDTPLNILGTFFPERLDPPFYGREWSDPQTGDKPFQNKDRAQYVSGKEVYDLMAQSTPPSPNCRRTPGPAGVAWRPRTLAVCGGGAFGRGNRRWEYRGPRGDARDAEAPGAAGKSGLSRTSSRAARCYPRYGRGRREEGWWVGSCARCAIQIVGMVWARRCRRCVHGVGGAVRGDGGLCVWTAAGTRLMMLVVLGLAGVLVASHSREDTGKRWKLVGQAQGK